MRYTQTTRPSARTWRYESRAAASLGLMALLVMANATGCKRTPGDAATDAAVADPTLVVRDDSQGLLLTWIDERGDFHVEQAPKDVSLAGRDVVRVVESSSDEGARGDRVVVADLRVARADGSYPVRWIRRTEFDELALERRQKFAPTLASAPSGSAADAGEVAAAARPAIVIYGASWCGACHQAADWLKQKKIAFVEKDIETDPGAAAEMQAKLQRAHLPAGSIPVIDVRGVVLVGFSPPQIEAALSKSL